MGIYIHCVKQVKVNVLMLVCILMCFHFPEHFEDMNAILILDGV